MTPRPPRPWRPPPECPPEEARAALSDLRTRVQAVRDDPPGSPPKCASSWPSIPSVPSSRPWPPRPRRSAARRSAPGSRSAPWWLVWPYPLRVRWEGCPASAVGNGAWWTSAARRKPDRVSLFPLRHACFGLRAVRGARLGGAYYGAVIHKAAPPAHPLQEEHPCLSDRQLYDFRSNWQVMEQPDALAGPYREVLGVPLRSRRPGKVVCRTHLPEVTQRFSTAITASSDPSSLPRCRATGR